MRLEVSLAAAGYEADKPGEDHCADDGDEDAHDEAVLADSAEAEFFGDEAADEGAE